MTGHGLRWSDSDTTQKSWPSGAPTRAGGAEADHRDATAPAAFLAPRTGRGRYEHERHVGHVAARLAQRCDALVGGARALDVDRAPGHRRALGRRHHARERAAELEHDG